MALSADKMTRDELNEAKDELYSVDAKRVKKILRRMAVQASFASSSANISVLLPDVMQLLETTDVEQKKMVYLFMSSLAATNPDAMTMAFNRMVRDVSDANPLIRALALRTLSGVRVENLCESMIEPVRIGMHDNDPFVRKTAALAVAKMFDMSPEVVERGGLLPELSGLLGDSNAHVVANAATALNEITERAPYNVFDPSVKTINKMLATINECTEWNQVALLDMLVLFKPATEREALTILERVQARLNHSNAAVVMSATKVMLQQLTFLTDPDTIQSFLSKMAQPLCTLMSLPADIQYVLLRNLKVIAQKHPTILPVADVKIFFCKYNDPSYVKMEKVDTILALTTEQSVHIVLVEMVSATAAGARQRSSSEALRHVTLLISEH